MARSIAFALCLLCATPVLGAPKAKPTSAAEVTFVGYRALSGGKGVLFVELSHEVTVEVNRAGPVIEYKLVGASVPLKNNKNPLLLRDFASSALSAVLVTGRGKAKSKHGAEPGVRLVVTLRGNVQPTHKVVAHGSGAALEIELPAAP